MIDSTGGNDILISNDGDNTLYGDAHEMVGTSTGGNDILISGFGLDTMYGDAAFTDASTTGGNDILYGNGGSDIFITGSNTNAQTPDYNQDEGDKIAGKPTSKNPTTVSSSEQQSVTSSSSQRTR
jgi:Ca2+-binding RTX toxin-like protein